MSDSKAVISSLERLFASIELLKNSLETQDADGIARGIGRVITEYNRITVSGEEPVAEEEKKSIIQLL